MQPPKTTKKSDMINKIITVKNLLDKYVEFQNMVPDKENWNEDILKDNPPRYYRFKELKSL